VPDNNFRQKCFYVGVMLRRMIEAMLNKDAMDDKVIWWPSICSIFEVWLFCTCGTYLKSGYFLLGLLLY